MNIQPHTLDAKCYAKCVEVGKRICWDIDRDVIRGRKFDFTQNFLPESLCFVDRLEFLRADERRLMSQVQGRTYANMLRLVECFVDAKILELCLAESEGDRAALEALVRFTDDEVKHRELFRRIEGLIAEGMPAGYRFVPQTGDVAEFVLGKSTWAVLAMTCHIELFTQEHYRQSIAPDARLSHLYSDVLFFHWLEASQHAILAELEWVREDMRSSAAERDSGVNDLIELVQGVDALLLFQAPADVDYFVEICNRTFTAAETGRLHADVLRAYRFQFIVSGTQQPHIAEVLGRRQRGPGGPNQYRAGADPAGKRAASTERPSRAGGHRSVN